MRRMQGIFVVGLGAALMALGCSESSPASSESSATGASTGAADQGVLAGEPSVPDPFREIEAALKVVTSQEWDYVADCMADVGFPQQQEALRLRAGTAASAVSGPLRVDPLEFGPYQREQAVTYGVVGLPELFEDEAPASVYSEDPAFDEELERCTEEFEGSEVLASASQQYVQLFNDVADEFGAELDPLIEPVIFDRLECMDGRGYTGILDLAGQSWPDTLAGLGIEQGRYENLPPIPEVEPGQVVVIPNDTSKYIPSDDEVGFAVDYVECGDEVSFVEKLTEAQGEVRSKIVARYETEFLAITEQVNRISNES